jgi:hypothetical protein
MVFFFKKKQKIVVFELENALTVAKAASSAAGMNTLKRENNR